MVKGYRSVHIFIYEKYPTMCCGPFAQACWVSSSLFLYVWSFSVLLFVFFLSDCFPNFCGKASRSNFCSILSFLVKTEFCLQSVPPLPFSKHLQTPHIHSVLSPVFWRYCRTFPNITNLQTWTKNSVWTFLNVFLSSRRYVIVSWSSLPIQWNSEIWSWMGCAE